VNLLACMYLCRQFRPILPSDPQYQYVYSLLQDELQASNLFTKKGGRNSEKQLINEFEADAKYMNKKKREKEKQAESSAEAEISPADPNHPSYRLPSSVRRPLLHTEYKRIVKEIVQSCPTPREHHALFGVPEWLESVAPMLTLNAVLVYHALPPGPAALFRGLCVSDEYRSRIAHHFTRDSFEEMRESELTDHYYAGLTSGRITYESVARLMTEEKSARLASMCQMDHAEHVRVLFARHDIDQALKSARMTSATPTAVQYWAYRGYASLAGAISQLCSPLSTSVSSSSSSSSQSHTRVSTRSRTNTRLAPLRAGKSRRKQGAAPVVESEQQQDHGHQHDQEREQEHEQLQEHDQQEDRGKEEEAVDQSGVESGESANDSDSSDEDEEGDEGDEEYEDEESEKGRAPTQALMREQLTQSQKQLKSVQAQLDTSNSKLERLQLLLQRAEGQLRQAVSSPSPQSISPLPSLSVGRPLITLSKSRSSASTKPSPPPSAKVITLTRSAQSSSMHSPALAHTPSQVTASRSSSSSVSPAPAAAQSPTMHDYDAMVDADGDPYAQYRVREWDENDPRNPRVEMRPPQDAGQSYVSHRDCLFVVKQIQDHALRQTSHPCAVAALFCMSCGYPTRLHPTQAQPSDAEALRSAKLPSEKDVPRFRDPNQPTHRHPHLFVEFLERWVEERGLPPAARFWALKYSMQDEPHAFPTHCKMLELAQRNHTPWKDVCLNFIAAHRDDRLLPELLASVEQCRQGKKSTMQYHHEFGSLLMQAGLQPTAHHVMLLERGYAGWVQNGLASIKLIRTNNLREKDPSAPVFTFTDYHDLQQAALSIPSRSDRTYNSASTSSSSTDASSASNKPKSRVPFRTMRADQGCVGERSDRSRRDTD
jgi:hypothetical protein